MSEQLMLGGVSAPWEPVLGINGEWGTAGGLAVRESLSRGSLDGVMDVLAELDAPAVAKVLQEAGFQVTESAIERGRDAVLAAVQKDLIESVNRRIDGFELHAEGLGENQRPAFAAKGLNGGFRGNQEAAGSIQAVLGAAGVQIDLLGAAPSSERGALLCIAGQALLAGVQGFGFDGVRGKFAVPFSMHEVVDLHQAAATAVAVESVREAIGAWRSGEKVGELSKWIPDSVQRLLQGSLSEQSAEILVRAVDEGTVGRYAGEAGVHGVTQILAQHGVEVDAPTIDQQAEALGLLVVEPDRQRGKYVGPVVGVDYRAGLIKFARTSGVAVPFSGLAEGQAPLQLGDTARLEFNRGAMTVKVAEREGKGVGR